MQRWTAASTKHAYLKSLRALMRNELRDEMLDLNEATAEELDAIPPLHGHGYEIVRYRGERGRFTDLRQLNEVPGLAGKADGIEGLVTVDEN